MIPGKRRLCKIGLLSALTGLLLLSGCQPQMPAPPPAPTEAMPTAAPATPTPTPAPAPVANLPQASDGLSWWNHTVFYEVFVRSFYDANGDGIGDFAGLIAKLDYLNDGNPATNTDLGVNGLWLMPIMPSPSYHGYDVTDYEQVNPEYGTLDDFRRLLSEAHRRGIRIIIDMPLNHTSIEHPWFITAQQPGSPRADWYLWSNERPNYGGPWGQNVWHALGDRFYYGIFWEGMPDLNFRNEQVVAEMERIGAFWLRDVGVDGFRLDAARYILESGQEQVSTPETHAWWQRYAAAMKQIEPEALLVGEVWASTKEVAAYVKNDELDLTFEFDLARNMVEAARNRFGLSVGTTQNFAWNSYPPQQFATFLTNHDQNRVMSALVGNAGKARLAAALLLTAPGVPFIYYGEEIGMVGVKPDEQIRTPMQWSAGPQTGFTTAPAAWIESSVQAPAYRAAVNVETQSAAPDSLLAWYRTLIHLRNEHTALRAGEFVRLDAGNNRLYAFLRASPQETLLVLINLAAEPVSDYGVTLEKSALSGAVQPLELLSGAPVAPLTLDAAGGFADYRPLPELASESLAVIRISQ